MSKAVDLIAELRGFAEGSTSARASLMRDAADTLEQALTLVRDFTDADPCWFDHNGGCQAHGYLTIARGQMCPHEEAKLLLADPATEHTIRTLNGDQQ